MFYPPRYTLSILAQAIHEQKPTPHLLRLIHDGADVNQKVLFYPHLYYEVPLIAFTVSQYSDTRNILVNPPKRHRRLHYLIQVVGLLLDHGADPIYFPLFDNNLVSFLCEDSTLLKRLIEHGLDINLPGEIGTTPLCSSIKRLRPWINNKYEVEQHCTVIRQLLDHGADPDLQDRKGLAALHHLLLCPITPPVFKLLQYMLPMVDVCREDNQGDTPLHHYVDSTGEHPVRTVPTYEVIDILLSAGANPLARNNLGYTPIEKRQNNGHSPCLGLEDYPMMIDEQEMKGALHRNTLPGS